MRVLLIVLLSTYCILGFCAGNGRPVGLNCGLSGPPEGAGEDNMDGKTLLIFPRARDISKKYTGCQTKWFPEDGKWTLMNAVFIEKGDATRIWVPHASNDVRLSCRYRNGEVVKGDERSCVSPKFLISFSLAPGCVAKIRKALAEHDLATMHAPGCEYE